MVDTKTKTKTLVAVALVTLSAGAVAVGMYYYGARVLRNPESAPVTQIPAGGSNTPSGQSGLEPVSRDGDAQTETNSITVKGGKISTMAEASNKISTLGSGQIYGAKADFTAYGDYSGGTFKTRIKGAGKINFILGKNASTGFYDIVVLNVNCDSGIVSGPEAKCTIIQSEGRADLAKVEAVASIVGEPNFKNIKRVKLSFVSDPLQNGLSKGEKLGERIVVPVSGTAKDSETIKAEARFAVASLRGKAAGTVYGERQSIYDGAGAFLGYDFKIKVKNDGYIITNPSFPDQKVDVGCDTGLLENKMNARCIIPYAFEYGGSGEAVVGGTIEPIYNQLMGFINAAGAGYAKSETTVKLQ